MNELLNTMHAIRERWEEVEKLLSDPVVIGDQKRSIQLGKEYRDLGKIVSVGRDYEAVISNIQTNKKILQTEKDEEFRDMARLDLEDLEQRKEDMEEEIRKLLIPKDPEDDKNAILEIRSGTGGDEASIFAGDLYRMYTRFIEEQGWKQELISESEGTAGGFKEVIINITGEGVYGLMKFESGVHRVQRVPATESQGRVHTSAATVAVLPEADEVDVVINDSDIRKDVFRASGAGGQHVNRTESAVRVTHIPTGIVAECQDGRSQIKNYEQALKVLRSRIFEMKLKEHQDKISEKRKTMVSTGDRSAKIRTYNYPQGRMTDHRINLTLYNLDDIMHGNILPIIEALQMEENAEKMKSGMRLV